MEEVASKVIIAVIMVYLFCHEMKYSEEKTQFLGLLRGGGRLEGG